MIDKYFKINERNSTIKTEIIAGITTFLAMSYILAVNPMILSASGMNEGAVFTATFISSAIGCFIMGIYANYPIAQAPGLGMNSFFAYTVVLGLGYQWQDALFAVFISGIIFIILSVSGLREAIINIIPSSLKAATSAGIGLFIAFIGLQSAGIIVSNPDTLVAIGDLSSPTVLIALLGLAIMFFLHARGNKFAVFIAMALMTLLSLILNMLGIDVGINQPESLISLPPSIAPVAFQIFGQVNIISLITDVTFWTIIFSFLFVGFFDATGTLLAVGSQASIVDQNGNIKDSKKVLLSDGLATTIGAVLGTSSVTVFVESLSGISLGGRTGLTAVVVGICFLLAGFFSGLLSLITPSITAPALIMVGSLMAVNKAKINYNDFACTASSFMTMLIMVVAYSIAEGIAFGFLTYIFIRLAEKKFDDIHPLLYILGIIFLLHLFTITISIVIILITMLYIVSNKMLLKKFIN